jgi:hypothetical protein
MFSRDILDSHNVGFIVFPSDGHLFLAASHSSTVASSNGPLHLWGFVIPTTSRQQAKNENQKGDRWFGEHGSNASFAGRLPYTIPNSRLQIFILMTNVA